MSDFPVNQVLERLSALATQSALQSSVLEELRIEMRAGVVSMLEATVSMRAEMIGMIGGLRSDMMTMRSEIMARIDRLQDTVNHLRDETFVNFSQVKRIERHSAGATEDTRLLASQVTAMQRVMLNLSGRVDEYYPKG